MSKQIFTIQKEVRHTIEIKKSRFIAYTFKCKDKEKAEELIRMIKNEHPSATHCCWAYIYGLSGEHSRYNDDGEPHGTAGPPILEVIKKKDLTMVLAVVVRYYGGIKLGAGGLIRAYGGTAAGALKISGIKTLELTKKVSLTIPYNLLSSVENTAHEFKLNEESRLFKENVNITFYIPDRLYDEFVRRITDLSSGKCIPSVISEKYS